MYVNCFLKCFIFVIKRFCVPEVYINLNNLDFGLQQNKQRVHHVKLPYFCSNDPYSFVAMHK